MHCLHYQSHGGILVTFVASPVRIYGHADDVPLCAVVAQGVKVIVVEVVVISVVKVYYHLCLWHHLLHGVIASLEESGILLGVVLKLAYRPHHAVGGLVAHLHPFHRDAVVFKHGKHLLGMVCHIDKQLLVLMLCPCRGYVLLGWVCPPVAVMEVNHDVHAQLLGTQCLDQHILFVAPIAMLCRVNPYAQANGIESHLLHQGSGLTFLALVVIELVSAALHLCSPTDVGSKGEVCCVGCKGCE